MTTTLKPTPVKTAVGNYFISNYPPFSRWKPEYIPRFLHVLARTPKPGPLGLYVHLPFCRQRCHYCYFRVYPRRNPGDVELYLDSLLKELSLYLRYPALINRAFSSVYFGGGSPSYLSVEQINRLLGGLQDLGGWDAVEECTFECEPGTTSVEKFLALRELGVTRVSIGFQSLDDDILRRAGRNVRVEDCTRAFHQAREAGFDEINVDLLAGLPGETDRSWQHTLDRILELVPDCVTIYQLELTHNSALYASMKAGREIPLASWPNKQRWVGEAFDILERVGYAIGSGYMAIRHPEKWRFVYTVEHFWHGADLLALGETAFGHIQGVHYQNADVFEQYVGLLDRGKMPLRRAYRLSAEEKLRREVILHLKTGGLDAAYFQRKFGVNLLEHFQPEFSELIQLGLMTIQGDAIRLTREGLLEVDWLLPDFYLPQHAGIRYT